MHAYINIRYNIFICSLHKDKLVISFPTSNDRFYCVPYISVTCHFRNL